VTWGGLAEPSDAIIRLMSIIGEDRQPPGQGVSAGGISKEQKVQS
jgi:hypothetical protein